MKYLLSLALTRTAKARIFLAFWLLLPNLLLAQTTNTLHFSLGSFGSQSYIYSVHLKSVVPAVISNVFYVNPPQDFSVAAYPSIATNGTLTVSNQISGIVMQITISGYEDFTTNYCIPVGSPTNSLGQVEVGQWVGQFFQPSTFAWSTPIITNLTIGGNAYATNAGTAFAIDQGATNQVNTLALAQAQTVVATNITPASQVTGLANGATNATGTNLMDAAKGIAGFQWLQHLTSGSTNPGSVQIAADSAWGGGPWIDMDNTLDQITIHAAVVNFSDVATATVSGQFYGHLFGDADTADLASLATGLAPGSASNRLAAAVQPGTAPSLGLANVTGTLPAATLPGNVVTNQSLFITNTITPNGTNDSSAIIQAALNISNSVCRFAPGDYYATNLWVNAPNIIIEGNGATIHQTFAASQYFWRTNAQWYQCTNFCFLLNAGANQYLPGIRIYDLNLDGGQPANYANISSFTLYQAGVLMSYNSLYALLVSPTSSTSGSYAITNNFGFGWNNNGGGELVNCSARNFGGVGFYISGVGQSVPYGLGAGNFHHCSSSSNWCGYIFQTAATQTGAFQSNLGNAEYCLVSDISAVGCAFGAYGMPSNMQLHDSSFDGCYVGIEINGGSDDNSGPHTIINGLKCNHDICGLYVDATCDYVGIAGFYCAATTTNIIKQSSVTFFGGSIAALGIYCDDSSKTPWCNFMGTEVAGVFSFSNNVSACPNVLMSGCKIFGKCGFNGGIWYDLNNFAAMSWANWTNDVVTNSGLSGLYYLSGQTGYGAGLPKYSGTFSGNGSGLTNLPAQTNTILAGLAGLPNTNVIVFTNSAGVTLAGTFSGNAAGLTNIPSSAITGGTGTGSNALALLISGAAVANQSNAWVSLAGLTNIAQVNFTVGVYTNMYFAGCSNMQAGFSFTVWLTQSSTQPTNIIAFNTNFWQPQVFGQILTMPTNSSSSAMLLSCFATGTNVVKFTQTLFP